MPTLDLIENFRDKDVIEGFAKKIAILSQGLREKLVIMEVCGGHTHTIMRYGLNQLMPKNIEFIHGPGCPVCVMPKNRINQAYDIAMQKDTILLSLGDMIKIPGSFGSLADARARGARKACDYGGVWRTHAYNYALWSKSTYAKKY